ncbi:MAG TPA: response regulator transcription factor [Nitrospiraceae bacterium]|nr:response regulator transcription factor [Nitrospiraceae bacterium]
MAILIVDDSRDEQTLLSTRLRTAGYEALMVTDSAETVLGMLTQESAGQGMGEIDLILMDIMLPGVDGLEACRRIKAIEWLRDIPIIVITVKTDEQALLAAFAAGAMDYIRKPVNPAELVARVASALTLKKERDTRKAREQELLMRTQELEQALREVKVLHGLIPICAKCKRVRTDNGDWQYLEEYIQSHSEAEFSHGICQVCMKEVYPGVIKD